MKKFIFALVFCTITTIYTDAIPPEGCQIVLRVSIVKDGNVGNPIYPRTPILIPTIILDNHTLYLYSGCDNTTIEILDEDEMVVYSASITEGTETIELPSALIGTYEIHISRGMFVFTGEIEL